MADLLGSESSLSVKQLTRGQVLEGTVISLTNHEALVDVGAKAEGVIPENELKGKDVVEGDKVLVYVITPEDRRGQIILSLNRAKTVQNWNVLVKALEEGNTLEAVVNSYNKGGLIVDILGLQGFVPFSHSEVAGAFAQVSDAENQATLEGLKGQTLKVRLIELDRDNDRVILSEKEALVGEELTKRREQVLSIEVGALVEGTITAVVPYGIMMSIDGVEALIPQEEISWDEQEISQILSEFEVGQTLKAEVLSVDEEMGKVQLSLKSVTADPWKELSDAYSEGDKAEGTVTKITSYGIFVSLPNTSIEGMIALSSLPEDSKLKIGSSVPVEIAEIDVTQKQLGLVYTSSKK